MPIKIINLSLLVIGPFCTHLRAEETEKLSDWKNDTLTGDWGGTRASLYKSGMKQAVKLKV